jgi:hypothetical protein
MQPQSAVHHGLPGIDARPVGAIVAWLQAFPGQQFSVGDQEFSSSRPLSVCSTHRMLYWSLWVSWRSEILYVKHII